MMKRQGAVGLVAIVLIVSPLARAPASAQSNNARIAGVIRDETTAVIGDVDVDALETASGRSWTSTTNTAGAYELPAIAAGTYRVTARRAGFKTAQTPAFTVNVGQTVRLDITLQLGSFDDHVEVSAAASIVQTAASDVSFAVTSREASRLPSNGQNYMWLTLLAPGAVTPNPGGWATGQRTTSGGRPYINGNRKEANNFQLDGVDANQTTDNLVAYQPSLEAIEQIHIVTNNALAEMGNYQGGLINVTLKSGTNSAHGLLFEFVRDDALNAASWSAGPRRIDPLNPHIKPPFRDQVFGGAGGGPVVRNRIFFFADYQATRIRNGRTVSLVTVLPNAMRRGDFSALLAGPNPQQLYDPLTTRPDPLHPGQFVRDPFPNNRIPRSRINPVASALFASPFYPAPDTDSAAGNLFNVTESFLDNDQADVKIDAKPQARDALTARYSHGRQRTTVENSLPILLANGTASPFRGALVEWTRQGHGSVYNQARFGFTRTVLTLDGGIDAGGIGALGDAIGIAGVNRRAAGLPGLSFGGAITAVGSSKVVQEFATNTFQYQDSVAWRHGRHAMKAGGQALRYDQNVYFSGNNGQLGLFEFSGQYTRDIADPRSIGSPVADFMLGYPTRMARGDFAEPWTQRTTLWSAFVQDDWRASTNLTANLGLRYEYRTPLVEAHDRQANVDLATGRLIVAGRDGNGRALYSPVKWGFQPRVGLAWTPARAEQRLVIRGAYGISRFQEGTGTNLRLTMNPPFFNEFETINRNPASLGASIDSGFDALREKDPLVGTVLRAWDPQMMPARSQQWNVTVERAIDRSTSVAVAYIGQRAIHLVVPVNADQPRHAGDSRPLDSIYPQIGSVVLTAANADQQYNGLQTSARKRWSNGWEIIAAYTWSSAMSHGRGFFSEGGQTAEPASFWPNPYDRDAEWGPVPFDVRHNLTAAGISELPFGRTRRWLSTESPWIEGLVGGWSIAAVWRAHTGFPITILAPDQSGTGARSGRPDQIGSADGPHNIGPGQLWFNTSAFVLPKSRTFGNAPVGSVRGPGLNVIDASIAKRIAIAGRSGIDLRVEAFNVVNRPQFNAPDRSLTSATFGQVLSAQLSREIQLAAKFTF